MTRQAVKSSNRIRWTSVFALLVSAYCIPISQPLANAAVAGTAECASDISYLAGATTNYVDGQCVVVFSGAPNAGGNRANSWTAPLGVTKVRILLVGGGGSGGKGGNGSNEAGGGGAGGLILAETSTVPGTTYDFTIGSGGSGASYGSSGNSSAAFGFEAFGGGKGGGSNGSTPSNPSTGGSGGGGAHNQVAGALHNQIIGRGTDGGTPGTPSAGAGGGGAGGKGKPSSGTSAAYIGGDGGEGFCSNISGESKCYAGGGGGTGSWSNSTQIYGAGGSNVGGAGNGSSGTENTGSGGGGQLGNVSGNAGNGGSGVLIIRWSPTGFTNSLKMFVKNDVGATTASTITNAGKFYTSCSTTEDTFPYAGATTAAHNWGGDADEGGPAGCGSDGFTVYATGWIKAPSTTFKIFTKGDDGSRIDINGTRLVNIVADQGPNLQPETNTATNQITVPTAGNWYRIDAWLHENGGGAALEILWSTNGGITVSSIPSTNLTYQFPSVIKSVSYSTLNQRESSTVTASLDTTTAKIYNDFGNALLAQVGNFQVSDSGTASTSCSAFAADAQGLGSCIWRPDNRGTRVVALVFTPTDTYGINGISLFLQSTSSVQISAANQSLVIGSMFPSIDTDTAMNITTSGQYASLTDTTSSVFDVSSGVTIEAWVRPTNCSGSTERNVVYKANAYAIYCKSGNWWFKLQGSSAWSGIDTGESATANVWQHVTLERYAGESVVSFFVDGRKVSKGSDGLGSGNFAQNNNDFIIGANETGTGGFLGKIDEVRLYVNSTLGELRLANGIKTDLRSYADTTTANLKAYFDFNESSTAFVHNRKSGALVSQDLRVYGNPDFTALEEITTTSEYTRIIFPRSYITAGLGWKMPVTKSEVQVLVVGGGGGGGGGYQGGGGGAGGMIETTTSLSAGFYSIRVGTGGSGRKLQCASIPEKGQISVAFSYTADGGGEGSIQTLCGGDDSAGSGTASATLPGAGGSGGGGNYSTSLSMSGGQGIPGVGNNGGDGKALVSGQNAGGGGGGAGTAGEAPTGSYSTSKGGNGGAGKLSSVLGTYVAGGGGGSYMLASSSAQKGSGGVGGGGDSGWSSGMNASSGQPNTGGGGGASNNAYGGDGAIVPAKAYILGFSGDGGSGIVAIKWSNLIRQDRLYIGQYIAFPNVSTYPLNVYGGSGTGTVSRSLDAPGTANCSLSNGIFITAISVGSCNVTAVKASDTTYLPETTTATIYWIQWSDAYATRVPSTPTEIVLQHKTQITKYNFDTLTVTSYQNETGTVVTQITKGSKLRIIGDGFSPTDSTTEVVFGGAELVDMNYSSPALQVVSDGAGGYYLLATVPNGAITDRVIVNSSKGTAVGSILTILSP